MSFETATLLDKQSSSLHRPLFPTYREHVLSKLKPLYSKAYEYYVGDYDSYRTYEANRFLTCHTKAVFARNNTTGTVRVLAKSCHLRFCPICNKARENVIRRNVIAWLEKQKYPKFLTLTLKNCKDDLRGEIDRLYQSFKALRRLKLIKKRVSGGIWFFQITRSKDRLSWHPHLHCVISGGYVPVRELSKAWMKLTGESMIVDIRLIKNIESAACEVARYAARSCNILPLSISEISELDMALARRRICGTWKSALKQKLTTPAKYDSKEWTIVGSWSAVIGCKDSVEAAKEIYTAWEKQTSLAAGITISYLDDFTKGLSPPCDIEIEEYGGY